MRMWKSRSNNDFYCLKQTITVGNTRGLWLMRVSTNLTSQYRKFVWRFASLLCKLTRRKLANLHTNFPYWLVRFTLTHISHKPLEGIYQSICVDLLLAIHLLVLKSGHIWMCSSYHNSNKLFGLSKKKISQDDRRIRMSVSIWPQLGASRYIVCTKMYFIYCEIEWDG